MLVILITACGADQNAEKPPQVSTAASTKLLAQTVTSNQSEVAIFSGKFIDYKIIKTAQGYQVIDKNGSGSATDIQSAKRLQFSDYSVSLDSTGTAAQVYRLYQAAFDRAPDLGGLGFHISTVDGANITIVQVAQDFIESGEFKQKYGNTDNNSFVTLLYNNVLHRAPDVGGLNYWRDLLDAGRISRAQTLHSFSESAENIAAVAPRIENGIAYAPYPRAGVGAAREVSGGKLTWGGNRTIGILLQDARGIEVPYGHLSCASQDEQKLVIARDCRTAVGKTLGTYPITVSGDGISASLTLQVIPPKKPFDTSGMSRSGGDYSVVVTPTGNVLAWGSNGNAVLGQGVDSSRLKHSSLPLLVKDHSGKGILNNVVAASTGSTNIMALTEDGTVLQWGSGAALPVNIPNSSGTADLSHVVQISRGGDNNATVLTDTGMVLSWGSYTGQGSEASRRFPGYVLDTDGKSPLNGIIAISSGSDFALALGSNGKVYSWGIKATVPQTIKRASDGAELTGIVAIAAGSDFALAVNSEGQVYAWGDNAWGQLGQNVLYGTYSQAALVKGIGGTGILSGIVKVSAGYGHALALDASGQVLSWGNTTGGRLGEGANGIRKSPYVPDYVVGPDSTGKLSGILTIAAGAEHSMALSKNGNIYMWGDGFAGALGQGGTNASERRFPVPLMNTAGSGALDLSPITAYDLLQQGSH
jgi:alpha-tubulin suppressor-like RCC1 family protein